MTMAWLSTKLSLTFLFFLFLFHALVLPLAIPSVESPDSNLCFHKFLQWKSLSPFITVLDLVDLSSQAHYLVINLRRGG